MTDTIIPIIVNETASTILIRPLEKADLPSLEWEGEFTHFRNLFSDLYRKIEKGTAKAWVVVTDAGHMVGQVFLQLTSDRLELADGWNRAYLYSFRIKPEYRNLGLGKKMMEVLESDLMNMNFTRITLNVARDNPEAIRLYHKVGYSIVAEEPGVWSYPDHEGVWRTVREPSWRMEKRLR